MELSELAYKQRNERCLSESSHKRNKENRDNSPSKSDPKDTLVIADIVSRGYYYEHTRQTQEFQRLTYPNERSGVLGRLQRPVAESHYPLVNKQFANSWFIVLFVLSALLCYNLLSIMSQ
ncbi:hypothetical protein SAMN04487897_1637 [Paenibacillus sp. yr247]|nr:hypothetical protein SAMN04487897_1637 [Paenibacillus sp. yr247]